LLQALARFIRDQKQIDVPLDAFRLEQLHVHLLMNFRVVDEHGRQLGMSRNFAVAGEWRNLSLLRQAQDRPSPPPVGEGLIQEQLNPTPSPNEGGLGWGKT
jgi:ATP-dependent helicase HrpA